MTKKKIFYALLIVLLFSFGSCIYYFFFIEKHSSVAIKDKDSNENISLLNEKETENDESKYYHVYVKYKDGGSSFVPRELNPGFRDDQDYQISTSFDDDGNPIDDKKMIVINNFTLSNENKEFIKSIIGGEKYNAAIKEIQEQLIRIKKDQSEGK
ncbi:hypothetical protein ACYRFS_06945 [Listeria kieliensis]